MTKRVRATRERPRGDLPGATVLPGPTDRLVRERLDALMTIMEQDQASIREVLTRALRQRSMK